MRRVTVLFLVALTVCASWGAAWSGSYRVSVSQIVRHPALDALYKGFSEYLKESGYEVRYNIHIARGDPSRNLQIASQIVAEDPDLVLTISTPSTQACVQKIKDKVIVFAAVTDPVGAGVVQSLEKPGANVTGTTDMSPVKRQLRLMRNLQPGLRKLGVIYNPEESNSVSIVRALRKECAETGISVEEARAVSGANVSMAINSLVGKCGAVYVPTDNTVVSRFETVYKICSENKLPLYAADVDSVPRGAIAALAIEYYRLGRQTGGMAERILNGTNPASMPVESLRELKLSINLKAAAVLGVTMPVDIILAADEVFD
jgi:putative ABC transport system substrate-binding protein